MFEWLEKEIADIKTRKFHIVDGPADETLRQAVENCDLPIPRSYKEFVLRFGNAKLYRKLSYYKVGVLASPREERYKEGGEVFHRVGHYDSNSAYFKDSLLREGEETPVFEGGEDRMHQVADSFEAWLTKRCKAARGKYNKRQWAEIVAGPLPFTTEEHRIVEARRRFTCRAVGVTQEGKFLFEVHNGSRMMLPFLSIGVRSKDNCLQGGIWLPVSRVRPGQTAVVEHEVYKGMADPSGIEVFVLPDPEPEDRERFWEFKAFSV
jgi:hypothetical protein